MRKLLPIFVLLLTVPSFGAVVFIAQVAAGSGDGSNCANAKAYTYTIQAGDQIHFCSIISGAGISTTAFTLPSGTDAAHPTTVIFEPGSSLARDVWGGQTVGGIPNVGGAINIINASHILIDGGSVGIIQNTANGVDKANQLASRGIYIAGSSDVEVKNLTIQHIYDNLQHICTVTNLTLTTNKLTLSVSGCTNNFVVNNGFTLQNLSRSTDLNGGSYIICDHTTGCSDPTSSIVMASVTHADIISGSEGATAKAGGTGATTFRSWTTLYVNGNSSNIRIHDNILSDAYQGIFGSYDGTTQLGNSGYNNTFSGICHGVEIGAGSGNSQATWELYNNSIGNFNNMWCPSLQASGYCGVGNTNAAWDQCHTDGMILYNTQGSINKSTYNVHGNSCSGDLGPASTACIYLTYGASAGTTDVTIGNVINNTCNLTDSVGSGQGVCWATRSTKGHLFANNTAVWNTGNNSILSTRGICETPGDGSSYSYNNICKNGIRSYQGGVAATVSLTDSNNNIFYNQNCSQTVTNISATVTRVSFTTDPKSCYGGASVIVGASFLVQGLSPDPLGLNGSTMTVNTLDTTNGIIGSNFASVGLASTSTTGVLAFTKATWFLFSTAYSWAGTTQWNTTGLDSVSLISDPQIDSSTLKPVLGSPVIGLAKDIQTLCNTRGVLSICQTDKNGVSRVTNGVWTGDTGAFQFVAAGNQLLTVAGLGNANGTICSDGAACVDGIINCISTAGVLTGICTHSFSAGASVTLTATATSGSFTGWSGACGGSSTCTLIMSAPFLANATFQATVSCTLSFSSNSINVPNALTATITTSGLTGNNWFWTIIDPFNVNLGLCNTVGCQAGLSGNLLYTSSGKYTCIACSNGSCTGPTQPLNVNNIGIGGFGH